MNSSLHTEAILAAIVQVQHDLASFIAKLRSFVEELSRG